MRIGTATMEDLNEITNVEVKCFNGLDFLYH